MSKRVFLRLACIALLAAEVVKPATAQVRSPSACGGDFRERLRQADLIVSGKILSTVPEGTQIVDGVDVTSNRASIEADRVFKGELRDRMLDFVWFSLPPDVMAYAGPPLANFAAGKRFLVFLREDATGYVVTIPLCRIEVLLAPASPLNVSDMSAVPDDTRDSQIARELETAARSIEPPAPGVSGYAVTYFPYVVDLVGGCAKPFLQYFTESPSKELRDVAQRWLTLLVDKKMGCNAQHLTSDKSPSH